MWTTAQFTIQIWSWLRLKKCKQWCKMRRDDVSKAKIHAYLTKVVAARAA
jgi:hypothetical protein